jgi:hypothetical protein
MQYEELINNRQDKCPIFHEVRNRVNEFHNMNEAFYNSLSATQVYELKLVLLLIKILFFSELKTDEDDHWQQGSLFDEKKSKLKSELAELQQVIYLRLFFILKK